MVHKKNGLMNAVFILIVYYIFVYYVRNYDQLKEKMALFTTSIKMKHD